MKKLYQSAKWKRYSQKVSRKALKKKQRYLKRKRKGKKGIKVKRHDRHVVRKKNKVRITAPSVFSIINNSEEMLQFFAETKEHIAQKRLINFDMSEIKYMTADGILSMVSLFDYWKQRDGFFNILGNIPTDEACKMLLIDSGFFNYVKSNIKFSQSNPHILSIESDSLAVGLIAQKVIDFTYKHLGEEKTNQSKSIYAMLIECMCNTRQHAYIKESILPKWWLIALYDKDVNKVHFAFVDNGSGIPGTVRKNNKERIKQIFFNSVKDSILIQSTLKGEFRTRTKQGYRGNGLPKILSYCESKVIDNLIIISNKGYVNCSNSECRELTEKFKGTLLSWDFIP